MYLVVSIVSSVSQCAPAADSGGKADQEFIWDDVVIEKRRLCLPALQWDLEINFSH